MRADAKYVPVDTQEVNSFLVVATERAIALQKQNALRVHIQLVRMRRQVVAGLAEVISACNDRLAGLFEVFECGPDALQFTQATESQSTQLQVYSANTIIIFCELKCIDHVLHKRLWHCFTKNFGNGEIVRITILLVDQRTDRLNEQRRLPRHQGHRAKHCTNKDEKHRNQE